MLAALAGVTLPALRRRAIHAQERERVALIRDDLLAIERAVAAAALRLQVKPGELIAPEAWRVELDGRARPALREHGTDPFGESYGRQRADREVVLPEKTRLRIEPLNRQTEPE